MSPECTGSCIELPTALQAPEAAEVSIRRRPPEGLQHQPCGNKFQFEVLQSEDNKPRNILEEIVW